MFIEIGLWLNKAEGTFHQYIGGRWRIAIFQGTNNMRKEVAGTCHPYEWWRVMSLTGELKSCQSYFNFKVKGKQGECMTDLMYCGSACVYEDSIKKLKQRFANVRIQDGSDDIHQYRYEVNLLDDQRENYFKFLIENQLLEYSFIVRLSAIQENEDTTTLLRLLGKEKQPQGSATKPIVPKGVVRNVVDKLTNIFRRKTTNGK